MSILGSRRICAKFARFFRRLHDATDASIHGVAAPAVTYTALATVIEIVAPFFAVTSAPLVLSFDHVALEPAVIDTAPVPVMEHVAPTLASTYATPSPNFENVFFKVTFHGVALLSTFFLSCESLHLLIPLIPSALEYMPGYDAPAIEYEETYSASRCLVPGRSHQTNAEGFDEDRCEDQRGSGRLSFPSLNGGLLAYFCMLVVVHDSPPLLSVRTMRTT